MQTPDEIKQHLRRGDMVKIGAIIGVQADYVQKLLKRPTAAKHKQALKEARKIAKFNQSLGLTK